MLINRMSLSPRHSSPAALGFRTTRSSRPELSSDLEMGDPANDYVSLEVVNIRLTPLMYKKALKDRRATATLTNPKAEKRPEKPSVAKKRKEQKPALHYDPYIPAEFRSPEPSSRSFCSFPHGTSSKEFSSRTPSTFSIRSQQRNEPISIYSTSPSSEQTLSSPSRSVLTPTLDDLSKLTQSPKKHLEPSPLKTSTPKGSPKRQVVPSEKAKKSQLPLETNVPKANAKQPPMSPKKAKPSPFPLQASNPKVDAKRPMMLSKEANVSPLPLETSTPKDDAKGSLMAYNAKVSPFPLTLSSQSCSSSNGDTSRFCGRSAETVEKKPALNPHVWRRVEYGGVHNENSMKSNNSCRKQEFMYETISSKEDACFNQPSMTTYNDTTMTTQVPTAINDSTKVKLHSAMVCCNSQPQPYCCTKPCHDARLAFQNAFCPTEEDHNDRLMVDLPTTPAATILSLQKGPSFRKGYWKREPTRKELATFLVGLQFFALLIYRFYFYHVESNLL
ncbi:hypothetical protein QR680_010247 [Steinernema hermaphroditum]|uniref:Uncharacterized protein n=1 Tax=Steinernema hermaphroditum TaxID=289476 RepID=A0AA39MBD3_9BILA|nr:hypothetical protein QR680_010247 [Steinernema hermaphroditum]